MLHAKVPLLEMASYSVGILMFLIWLHREQHSVRSYQRSQLLINIRDSRVFLLPYCIGFPEITLKLLVRSFLVVVLQRPLSDVISPTQSLVQPVAYLQCILPSYWSSRPSALTR